MTSLLRGIVFARSVRSFVCYLNVVVLSDDDDDDDEDGSDNDQDNDKQDDLDTLTDTNGWNHQTNFAVTAGRRAVVQGIDEESSSLYHICVAIQFDTQDFDTVKLLRSYFRRCCKLGDLMEFRHDGIWSSSCSSSASSGYETLTIRIRSMEQGQTNVRAVQSRIWNMTKVQCWQQKLRFYQERQQRQHDRQTSNKDMEGSIHNNSSSNDNSNDSSNNNISGGDDDVKDDRCGHGGGADHVVDKSTQATMIVEFLIEAMKTTRENDQNGDYDQNNDTTENTKSTAYRNVVQRLNGGSGVLDVAGGSGHVSMALGLRGIKSTVVDPREAVGKLPGRERKVWKRALKQQQQQQESLVTSSTSKSIVDDREENQSNTSSSGDNDEQSTSDSPVYCQVINPIQYSSYRAWFGAKPAGVEEDFRNKDKAIDVPVCDATDPMLTNCSAIVAFHPDEATDYIVDEAVRLRKPFFIVPCCVFCRLFPSRRIPRLDASGSNSSSSNKTVSTYDDLLEHLQSKHDSIQKSTLPFVGTNVVLWSTFEDEENNRAI